MEKPRNSVERRLEAASIRFATAHQPLGIERAPRLGVLQNAFKHVKKKKKTTAGDEDGCLILGKPRE